MGVALFAKAAVPRSVSVVLFGATQVAIDLEPGIRMALHSGHVHGVTHTVWGAPIAASLALLIVPLMRRLGFPVGSAIAVATVLLGAASHVVLDAVMHADVGLLWPGGWNPLYGTLDLLTLHVVCLALAAVGGTLVALRAEWHGLPGR